MDSGRLRKGATIAAGLLFLGAFASTARADKRIAVLNIEGARSARLRKTIERLIRPHKAIGPKIYRNAADRLRAPKLNPNDVAEVCDYLDVDGVVDGTLVADDGRYRLVVRIRAGSSGIIVKKIAMRLARPRLSEKIKKGLRKRLLAVIDDLESSAVEEDEAPADEPAVEEGFEDEPVSADDGKADTFEEDEATDASDDDELVPEGEGEAFEEAEESEDDWDDGEDLAGEDDDAEDAPRWKDPRTRPLIVLAGVSLVKRTLSFTTTEGLENEPAGYAGGMVPGVYIAGEVYPLALAKDRPTRSETRFGLTFLYDKAVQIESTVIDPASGMSVVVPTEQRRWGIGAAYRLLLGKGQRAPTLTLLAGYHKSRFVLDKEAAMVDVDVPNTKYAWADPGARFRIGLSKQAALHAEARFLLVMNTGDVQKPAHYGAAKVTGVDADIGLEYWLTPRYLLRLGARYTALGYDFQGNGALSDRDLDGEVDVGGALDAYLGGYATLGVGF